MENNVIAQITAATPVITEKTTLGEVMSILGLHKGQKKDGKTPTRARLRSDDVLPVAKMCGFTLYETGYVLYENGYGRHSVVWLPYCINFTYYFNKLRDSEKGYMAEHSDVPENDLMKAPWMAVVALFGEERITQKLNRGFGNADTLAFGESEKDEVAAEPEDIDFEGKFFSWDDGGLGADPLDVVIRRETRNEMLAAMTDKQREVFILYYKYGYTQREIGKMLGINHRAVGFRLNGAKEVAKKFF